MIKVTRIAKDRRVREIYAALHAKGAGIGVAVPELGRDALTLAALRLMRQAHHIELTERGLVRLTGQGLHEARRIEMQREQAFTPAGS
jgi:hypothetical protein